MGDSCGWGQANSGLIRRLEVDDKSIGGVCASLAIDKTLTGLQLIVGFICRAVEPTETGKVGREEERTLVLSGGCVIIDKDDVSIGGRASIQERT